MKMYRRKYFGNTLLEGVCIRLTRHLHNHDMTCYEYEGSYVHVYDNCHYVSFAQL